MNWEEIAAIGQVLGSIGVFISIAYLAMQTRTGAVATKHASQNAFISDYGAFLGAVTQPEVVKTYARVMVEDFREMDGLAQHQIHAGYITQYYFSLNVWVQMNRGQFEPRIGEPLIAYFATALKTRGGMTWWAMQTNIDSGFRRHIDSLIGDPSVPSLDELQPWWRKIATE